jgi:hypothetical protein
MSWKSTLKSLGKGLAKHVWTLGASFLIGRYVERRVPKAAADLLRDLVDGKLDGNAVPADVRAGLQDLARKTVAEEFTNLRRVADEAARSFARSLERNDELLSRMARDQRGR